MRGPLLKTMAWSEILEIYLLEKIKNIKIYLYPYFIKKKYNYAQSGLFALSVVFFLTCLQINCNYISETHCKSFS
jgi:hypothetical protein